MTLRSPFRWLGSKQRMVPTLRRLLPETVDLYLEPFFGSGTVLLSRLPAKYEIINDIDGRVVNFFRVLREQPDALVAALRLTPWAREEWLLCHSLTDDPIEDARRWYVLAWQSMAMAGQSSWIDGGIAPVARSRIDTLHAIAERMATVVIDNRDGVQVMAKYRKKGGSLRSLVYLDPPYLKATRSDDARVKFSYMHDDIDHEALLNEALQWSGMVAISSYPNELYDDTLAAAGWNRHEKTRLAAAALYKTKRTEVVWRNFTLQDRLF